MIETEQSRRVLRAESAEVNKQWKRLRGVYSGYRDKNDPITVRTSLIDVAKIMGVENPEWEEIPEKDRYITTLLLNYLNSETLWKPLNPEYIDAMVKRSDKEVETYVPKKFRLVVANGRHKAEPLWSGLAEYVDKKHPGEVAKFNPVGHYNDGQSRVAGIRRLIREVETFVVLGSTQTERGGSLEVLTHAGRLIRNVDFSSKIKNLAIVMPFMGGSRGHRLGQRDNLVYEVLEMLSSPKIPSLSLLNARERVWVDKVGSKYGVEISPKGTVQTLLDTDITKVKQLQDGVKKGEILTPDDLLKIQVITVDIHNEDLPRRKFEEMGIEFINADPTPELAHASIDIIKKNNMMNEAWLGMASDKGAIKRNERFVKEMLIQSEKREIFIGFMNKTRKMAGIVDKVEMGEIEKWTIVNDELVKEVLSKSEKKDLFDKGVVLIKNDDMIDTGGTNRKDEKYLRDKMKVLLSITVATHPVFSWKGLDIRSFWERLKTFSFSRFSILDKIGSDAYIFTNTLIFNGLSKRKDVTIVDSSPALARASGFE